MLKKGDKFNNRFLVSEAIYSGFIELFKDKNPYHIDPVEAKEAGFKDKIVHGNVLGGFLSFLIGECLPIKNIVIQKEEIKFLKPIFIDDRLDLEAEVVDIFESVNTAEIKYFFKNQEDIYVAKGTIQIGII